MKRERYDLTDEEFAAFISRSSEALKNKGIEHIIVGGTAVQAHMLKNLCEHYECDVEGLVLRDDVRLQDYIRSTDDVDMAWKLPGDRRSIASDSKLILDAVDSFSGEILSPSQNHILRYSLTRAGIKRPKFRVEVDGRSTEEDVIALNIGKEPSDLDRFNPELYYKFIEEGVDLSVPFCPGHDVRFRVIKPEYLMATKIANFRPKDAMDLQNLSALYELRGLKVDPEQLQKILCPHFEDNLGRYMTLVGQ